MIKFIGFTFLWWLLGNPFLALIILIFIFYFLDRRYVGVFPSVSKPFRRLRNIAKLRGQIAINHNDVSSKHELARLLIEREKCKEANQLLHHIMSSYEDSADYWDDLGTSELGLGNIDQGEQYILRALSINDRVKYGEPYLRLAFAFRHRNQEKALQYVEKFRSIQSSSCEGYYLLGSLYSAFGRMDDAKRAYQESIAVYRSLPKYKKRQERKWALRSFFKNIF